MDASSLVFDIHGVMLRTLCTVGDRHYQGLAAAATDSYRKGLITLRQKHRMISVDHAFQVIRHITTVSVRKDTDELYEILRKHTGDDSVKHSTPYWADTAKGVQTRTQENSAQAGDSCNTDKRRRVDSNAPPYEVPAASSGGDCAPPLKTDDGDKAPTAAATEVMSQKMSDIELLIQKVRREGHRKYEDYRQTIDALTLRCGQIENVIVDMKDEVMLQIRAQEVISGVIRAEKAKECGDTQRRLEILEKSNHDMMAQTVQLARDSQGCVHSLRDTFLELKRP